MEELDTLTRGGGKAFLLGDGKRPRIVSIQILKNFNRCYVQLLSSQKMSIHLISMQSSFCVAGAKGVLRDFSLSL